MLTDLVIILSVWSLLTIPLSLLGGFLVELLEPRQTDTSVPPKHSRKEGVPMR